MRILVIDDTQENLDAAIEQLKGHEVITVASFTEAHKLLGNNKSTSDTGPDGKPYVRWREGAPEFDVVLTDLFMPAASDGGNEEKAGEATPYGLVFTLAAIRRGIPMVAIVTTGNHHSEPMLWALDLLGLDYTESIEPYKIGNTIFACCNHPYANKPKNWDLALKKVQG